MANIINFGIDLGTTNSLIARFDKGVVEVFKNPIGFKETLPSVVGFRKDRILVGDQARVYQEKDAKSVVGRFKRKMGTTESYKIKSLGTSKTPVELSALVLQELKGFVHTGEQVDSAVITIPTSFDTVQSISTKDAGVLAGLKTVVLLQEPIAASLAYANKEKNVDLRNSQWLVYDLGGGTFDVALVRIVEGELTIVDHEGDNFFGGTDFDEMIVEKLIVPELERRGSFVDLIAQMTSQSGARNSLWYLLLNKAEEAKIELSARTSTEIDLGLIQIEDDEGELIDAALTITRSEFEGLIKDPVDRTIAMIRRILTRNSLRPAEIKFVLMVGGSTYIPFVRSRVQESLGVPVNTGIDPTNAIAIGAAYYAGTKEKTLLADVKSGLAKPSALKIKASYSKTSQEAEETFTAKIEGGIFGYRYRITGLDGAYDSGLKELESRIVEDLPLREQAYNVFELRILDPSGNQIPLDFGPIQIAQGRYGVAGQMLPEDICLVKDDIAANDTRLTGIFQRNAVLPAKQGKKVVEVAKTVVKGAADEAIHIMIVEGSADRHSSTCKSIGVLSITGADINRDLIKGTEIDLNFEMSESRDLTVSAYLNGTGQQFSQVFRAEKRDVLPKMLAAEIVQLEDKVQEEIEHAEKKENAEVAQGLEKVLAEVRSLYEEGAVLAADDSRDKKFQLEDKKRRLAQEMYELTAGKRLDEARAEYKRIRTRTAELVDESGNDREKHVLAEFVAREPVLMSSSNLDKIKAASEELDELKYGILLRTPDYLTRVFNHLLKNRVSMNDQMQAGQLIENGKRVLENEDWDDLREINGRLWDLMPDEKQTSEEFRVFTGIV